MEKRIEVWFQGNFLGEWDFDFKEDATKEDILNYIKDWIDIEIREA